ncbi:hypothetical protein H8D36_05740 [archaeon]|nr:hypothetical protein [archaeon]MBL7057049.1 hypothetical protein [Candidatus Woesearchaeota archaeon]
MKITTQKENQLLGRTEVEAEIAFTGATPSREDLKKQLAQQLKTKESLVIITSIRTNYGESVAVIQANVYTKDKEIADTESKHMQKRHEAKKKEATEEAPAEEAPKEEKSKEPVAEAKEEKSEPEAKPEETKVEEKKEEVKVEEKSAEVVPKEDKKE